MELHTFLNNYFQTDKFDSNNTFISVQQKISHETFIPKIYKKFFKF